jgi:hypothetical protein
MAFITSALVNKRKYGLPVVGGTFGFWLVTEKVKT